VTSSGNTIVNGNLGLWPGTAVTGFPPGKVTGMEHVNDPIAQAAEGDLTTAFNDAAGRSTAPILVAGNLGGQTLGPGLYKSATSLEISSGDLVLDGQGDPNAVFIFQMGSTFTTTSGRQVVLIGGAQSANVFWQVGSSATIGTTSGMKGNILADQSISIETGATLDGRALARNAAVTLQGNALTVPVLAGGPGGGPGGGPVGSTNLLVFAVSPITLNPQTGLFEQTVSLTNGSSSVIPATRLLIRTLPVDVRVYNATGSAGGTPFVQYNQPLAAGGTVDFQIEYYRMSRQQIPQPAFVAQETTASSLAASGPFIKINRSVQLPSGRFLIEFTAVRGRRYLVQYSSDRQHWKNARPVITAPSNRVQWYDDGPPKTDSKPTSLGSRFYRVEVLP
jgi:hypothetical protein